MASLGRFVSRCIISQRCEVHSGRILSARCFSDRYVDKDKPVDSGEMHPAPEYIKEPMIPPYEEKLGEPIHLKKARLMYQSRKRGMLENGLLLSAFAHQYLAKMNASQLSLYDRLINLPSNDWEIYYWATGVQPVPEEFQNEIMDMLQQFVKNEDRENRCLQPNLH